MGRTSSGKRVKKMVIFPSDKHGELKSEAEMARGPVIFVVGATKLLKIRRGKTCEGFEDENSPYEQEGCCDRRDELLEELNLIPATMTLISAPE